LCHPHSMRSTRSQMMRGGFIFSYVNTLYLLVAARVLYSYVCI
jgi:hypothetical protein